MIEPVAAQHIMIAVIAGASTILTGALYAGLFAWGKLRRRPAILGFAYLAYAALVGCVLVLAYTLNLTGPWAALVVTLLAGYLLAPHGIWHLCVGTHSQEREPPGERAGEQAGTPRGESGQGDDGGEAPSRSRPADSWAWSLRRDDADHGHDGMHW